MTLSTLSLKNFRSYEDGDFDFEPGINVITGPNGSGKTNILEAIYILGLTRSFRGSLPSAVRRGEDWFRIESRLASGDDMAVVWNNSQKECLLNDVAYPPAEYIVNMPVVLFEPSGLDVVYGGPASRRQMMDRILSVTDQGYLRSLVQLRRILKQRNTLLRRPDMPRDQIFGWDVLLVEQAAYIRESREKLVEQLKTKVPSLYKSIAESDDDIEIKYSSQTENGGDYTDNLLTQLEGGLDQDFRYGFTRFGPHRDDLSVIYNTKALADVGSRGEVRTTALTLTLAEFDYIKQSSGKLPTVLLDDVFSELDVSRQRALLDVVEDTQVVVTSTELPSAIEARYNHIQLP